jgi:alkaline phosphatase D
MPIRIAHLTDTHLSGRNALFQNNFEQIASDIRKLAPDLVIHTGDLSLDGVHHEEDLAYAAGCQARLGVEVLALPGNHDVGEAPSFQGGVPVNAERVARFHRLVGPSAWVRDCPGWRLVGVNAQALDLDTPFATEQLRLLDEAARTLRGRRMLVALHMPMSEWAYEETTAPAQWFLSPRARQRLYETWAEAEPTLVISGHLHQWREHWIGGTRHCTAPASSFVVNEHWQKTFGKRVVGYLLHRLHANGAHETELRTVPGLVCHDIIDHPRIYG